ncbi:GNAT family N-acetyltransferase [Streptomyces sp. NPDC058157]|uniref:GNAT family N-acetyltransferase n=1 Tax=Streptomyces sp. NPDC058157 TaxID=3346360 RepID=UPI0036E56B7E
MIVPAAALHAPSSAGLPALVLRPWQEEDVPALVEACADPAMRRWIHHRADDEAEGLRWLAEQRRGWTSGVRFAFAVLEEGAPAPRRLLGNAVLKLPRPDAPSAEVGYWTTAHARGRGTATRALDTLTAWAFDTFAASGLARLDLFHQLPNEASCRVAEKSGYPLHTTVPASPPAYPAPGHLHVRRAAALDLAVPAPRTDCR